jgi:DNA-binding transcriptional LysR family regulator
MSDRIAALRLFVRVARLGGFSAAGREAGLPQSTVSRRIGELERAIGARLLTRTTRAVSLTDVGAEYMTRMRLSSKRSTKPTRLRKAPATCAAG